MLCPFTINLLLPIPSLASNKLVKVELSLLASLQMVLTPSHYPHGFSKLSPCVEQGVLCNYM